MKIRNGFVSNSSSSSFVVLKDALSEVQRAAILDYQETIDLMIKFDEEENWKDAKLYKTEKEFYDSEDYYEQTTKRLKYKFEYYESDPWRIVEYEDFIFGETSMDNFNMHSFLEYIKVDDNFIDWDDGWIEEPTNSQRAALVRMKQEIRGKKIRNINSKY